MNKTTYKTQISSYKAFTLKLLEITHFQRFKKIGFVFKKKLYSGFIEENPIQCIYINFAILSFPNYIFLQGERIYFTINDIRQSRLIMIAYFICQCHIQNLLFRGHFVIVCHILVKSWGM